MDMTIHTESPQGLGLLFTGAMVLIASGLPACFFPRHSAKAQWCTSGLVLTGSLLGWVGLIASAFGKVPLEGHVAWHLPWERLVIGIDALSAVFLIPVFTVPLLGSIYGLAYWRQAEHPENGRSLGFFYGLLAGGMAMVVLARNSVLFLIVWELMALAAFFLATVENEKPEVRRAGWIYLVATHGGTICLLALFTLLRQVSGSFGFTVLETGSVTPGIVTVLFLLSVVGFGFKAGLMPLHVWLPGAHANAPSHVSAMMSGVMLKMGIYGILRMLMLLPISETWNGGLLLGIGAVTGIFGIAFAIGQSDIKRLLAYSSIENIGIITMGIGLALVGRAIHRTDLVLLGLGGALLHVWNHSLFKSLLFLNTGAIMHAAHTRDMNRMGGLAKTMPATAGLFLLGAVAICGLPPLNGFVSEWLIYLGLFHGTDAGSEMIWFVGLAAVALALIGALALACFVKIYSLVFLGSPRQPLHRSPHDPSRLMLFPMGLLAAGCVVFGFLPQLGFPLLQQAVFQWSGTPAPPEAAALTAEAPSNWISGMALALVISALLGNLLLRRKIRRVETADIGTWGCGYAQPSARMQYTGGSFGQMLTGLFAWALRPLSRKPGIATPFPHPTTFSSEVPDSILERLVLPAFRQMSHHMMKLRYLQQGRTEFYLLYILIMVIFLFSWIRLRY